VDWIYGIVREYCLGAGALWRNSTFWLTAAAIVLPFGWLLFAMKLRPIRNRARYLRRPS
jgi:hypothetical protein